MNTQHKQRDSHRIFRLFLGLFVYAVGIVLTVHADIGLSPWDVLHQGLSKQLGITFGATSILVSAVIVLCVAICKEHVGIGTLFNMVFIGLFIDILMLGEFIPVAASPVTGVLMMVAGLFTIAVASVLYIGAGYGAGPRDSLMVVFSKRTGKPAGLCRSCVELVVLIAGWFLGGKAGIGTLISALGIGVAVQIVFSALHFNVSLIRQESFIETFRRIQSFFSARKQH